MYIYIYIYTNIYATRTSARTDTVEDGRTQSAYRCPFHAPGFTVSAQENASVHRGADMISDSISGVWGGGGGGKSSNFDPARLRCNTQKSAEGQEVQLQGAFCGLRHFGDGLESAREVFCGFFGHKDPRCKDSWQGACCTARSLRVGLGVGPTSRATSWVAWKRTLDPIMPGLAGFLPLPLAARLSVWCRTFPTLCTLMMLVDWYWLFTQLFLILL